MMNDYIYLRLNEMKYSFFLFGSIILPYEIVIMSTLVHYLENYLCTDSTDKHPKTYTELISNLLIMYNLLDRQYTTINLDYLSLTKNLTTLFSS